jgi:hypothetical protein
MVISEIHGTLSKTDHILWCKASLNKYKMIKTISCTLLDYNEYNWKTISKILQKLHKHMENEEYTLNSQ